MTRFCSPSESTISQELPEASEGAPLPLPPPPFLCFCPGPCRQNKRQLRDSSQGYCQTAAAVSCLHRSHQGPTLCDSGAGFSDFHFHNRDNPNAYQCEHRNKLWSGANEMAQRVKLLVTQAGTLSWIPGTHVVEGEN